MLKLHFYWVKYYELDQRYVSTAVLCSLNFNNGSSIHESVDSSVQINFSQPEPFSVRQKGRNRGLSRGKGCRRVRGSGLGPPEISYSPYSGFRASDMYDITLPIRFGFEASMYRIERCIPARAWLNRFLRPPSRPSRGYPCTFSAMNFDFRH